MTDLVTQAVADVEVTVQVTRRKPEPEATVLGRQFVSDGPEKHAGGIRNGGALQTPSDLFERLKGRERKRLRLEFVKPPQQYAHFSRTRVGVSCLRRRDLPRKSLGVRERRPVVQSP
jgi:hypothetical protein